MLKGTARFRSHVWLHHIIAGPCSACFFCSRYRHSPSRSSLRRTPKSRSCPLRPRHQPIRTTFLRYPASPLRCGVGTPASPSPAFISPPPAGPPSPSRPSATASTTSSPSTPPFPSTCTASEPGDIVFGLHAQFIPALFQYQVTVAFTAPTGDEDYGLTTGRVTFDLNNRFERSFGRFTPNLEIGAGDSTTLVNRILNKNYTSLGPLAHFQVGIGVEFFHGLGFETDVYEQLPIGDQKIYSAYRKNRPTVVTGYNVTEDNGIITALDIPIDRHTTLSGYYSRSLRRYTDTVAIGITYVLRGAPPVEETSFDDLFR